YLDGDQVLSSLSAIGEGDIVGDVLETSFKESGQDLGFGISLAGSELRLGGHRKRSIQQQLKRRQSIHTAIRNLLEGLTSKGAISYLRQRDECRSLEENLLVQFHADLFMRAKLTNDQAGGETYLGPLRRTPGLIHRLLFRDMTDIPVRAREDLLGVRCFAAAIPSLPEPFNGEIFLDLRSRY